MMTRTRAVVLRTVRYGDASLVVDMLTRQHGRVSFMVKVSKSPHGKMCKQLFQPLNIVEIDFDFREKSSLQRLRDTDGAVTVRERDSMEQVRVKIEDLRDYFEDKMRF